MGVCGGVGGGVGACVCLSVGVSVRVWHQSHMPAVISFRMDHTCGQLHIYLQTL